LTFDPGAGSEAMRGSLLGAFGAGRVVDGNPEG
jgi:hypothetical protein